MLGVLWTPRDDDPKFAPSLPAALYPVGGRPTVSRVADAASSAGADDVVLVTDEGSVRDRVHESGVPVDAVTGDLTAVQARAADHDRVLVANAATIVDVDALRRVAAAAPAVAAPSTDGGRVAEPPAYATRPAALESVESTDDLAALPQSVPESARVDCGRALDVRRPWELLAATEAALDEQDRDVAGTVHPDADCRGRVVVEPGATLEPGVVVEGPAYVSAGCTVGPNAYVRGHTFLGRDSRVGHAVEVKNSVVLDGGTVPHLTYVGDSVVGPDANLGAGSLVANVRHDDADVSVTHDGERVSTARRKFGAVVGEGAKLGIGTHLNVGVTVEAGATTMPGEVLTRDRRCDAS